MAAAAAAAPPPALPPKTTVSFSTTCCIASTANLFLPCFSPSSSCSVFHRSTSRRRRFTLSSANNDGNNFCSASSSSIGEEKESRNSGRRKPRALSNDAKGEKKAQEENVIWTALLGPRKKRRSLRRRIGRVGSKKVRSIILLNIITIVYASNIPVVKEVQEIVDPAAFSVARFAVSAIPFIPFVLQAWNDVNTRNAGIELGFWVSLGYLMQALGLETSDAGRASFLSMLTVIVVPLLDGMLGAIVPARTWFGALMSITGVALLESSGSPPCIGDLLNFLSAVFFGIHMLRTERISRSTNRKNFLPLLGYEVCVITVFSVIWYFLGDWSHGDQASVPSLWTWSMVWHWLISFPWVPALYTGLFSTSLCLWIEMAAMSHVSATETAIVYALEPVWGGGFAWFLLGERWGTSGWIGAALVLGGSLMVQIFASSSSDNSSEDEVKNNKVDGLVIGDEQNGFSASPAPVRSRKDTPSTLKKVGSKCTDDYRAAWDWEEEDKG